nr:hypothetical protein [Desulfobulbaceae bacterium]
MKKLKEKASMAILILVYLLLSFRYFPGNFLKTGVETLLEIFSVAPLAGGATLLLVTFLQRTSGEKVPWDRSLRLYLTVGVMAEFVFGVYHYLSVG